jgi:hypothetical protein
MTYFLAGTGTAILLKEMFKTPFAAAVLFSMFWPIVWLIIGIETIIED